MQEFIDAAILGVVEGITEFLPVSSTGHLIVTEAFLKRDSDTKDIFDVFIQIGAIMAVVWARKERVFSLATGFFNNTDERRMGLKIILAFLPAAIAGVLFHHQIKEVLFSPLVVAVSLIVGGIVLLVVERLAAAPRFKSIDAIPFKTALGIGICQIAALVPGVSRAGASIVGAEFLGVDRKTAAEFSFFLAIPTICGAAVYDLFKNRHSLDMADLPIFAIGTATAFLSALIVVNSLIAFVSKYGFKPFGYYRIVAGFALLILLYFNIL